MKINTIRYVFENRKPELRRLIVKYGLTPARNDQDLWKKTNYLVAKFKKEMLKDIADIHPDKELILWANATEHPAIPSNPTSNSPLPEVVKDAIKVMEKKASACGCSGADGEPEFSNCAGNPNCGCNKGKQPESNFSNADGGKSFGDVMKDNMPLVIVGSLILVGGLIFMGNK